VSKKSEERQRRKALKLQRFEAKKADFVARVNDAPEPKLRAQPAQSFSPKIAPHLAQAAAQQEKSPKASKDGSRFGARVTWCIAKADTQGEWTWGEPRAWQRVEWDSYISPQLGHFAQLTWGEIDRQSSESGHKMHHDHEISDLVDEAQRRWLELQLEEYDTVFRFRLGATKRAWGYIVQAHFHMVWWERHHRIYPVG